MINQPIYLSNEWVKEYLQWDTLVPVIERVISAVSDTKRSEQLIQPNRTIMAIPKRNGVLLSMPGFSENDNALGCKLVTAFPNNKKVGLPSILATILLFDSTSGKVSMILEGNEITAWRTAAASVVATKHLHNGTQVLAILGSGTQGHIHAQALHYFFNFKQIRIWNHNIEGARKLTDKLANEGKIVIACESAEECVRDADVIVTATFASRPILEKKWIKSGVHINAIGAGVNHHSELDTELYQSATIYVDSLESAKVELHGLTGLGAVIEGELGEIINGTKSCPRDKISVFHSLGMAVEDVASAKLIYDAYMQNTN